MGVSKNNGTQKWMVYMKNPIIMDDLGVPLFSETSIYTTCASTKKIMGVTCPASNLKEIPPLSTHHDMGEAMIFIATRDLDEGEELCLMAEKMGCQDAIVKKSIRYPPGN